MKIRLVSAVIAGVVIGGLISPIAAAADGDEWVQQIGTYDYLVSPNYAALAPIKSASKGATLGLGTFDHLDGELIMVGGESYRVGTDGTPVIIDGSQTTPFFESVKFVPTASGPVAPGTTCANLLSGVNALAQSDKGMVAVRVRGTFSDLTFRRAVLVGFRTGADLAGTGAPGLHLHGLTADRKAGGHVVSCVAGNDVQLTVQRTAGVQVQGAAH